MGRGVWSETAAVGLWKQFDTMEKETTLFYFSASTQKEIRLLYDCLLFNF